MLVAVLLKDKGDFFKDDKTHLAASTHGKDLRDVGVVTAVLAAFNVVDVDDGLGVDKQRLALAFALARTDKTSFMLLQRRARTHDYCRMRVEARRALSIVARWL